MSDLITELRQEGLYVCDLAADRIEELEAATARVPQWISVEDRLPKLKPGESCLWFQPAVPGSKGRGYTGLRARAIVDNCKPGPRLTTHWMPLPPPPEVKQDD